MKKVEYAYSKINLHLEVLKKRDDGYHDIFSIMAKTNLYDLLKLEKLTLDKSKSFDLKIVETTGYYVDLVKSIPVSQNLIYKAAKLYCEKAKVSAQIEISLEKNIPAGGGLGGGSADAAAILRLLNSKLKYLSHAELLQTAVQVGADVPFCLGGGVAICEGIGEQVSTIDFKLPYYVLIVNNGIHVDTKEAYSLIDKGLEKKRGQKEDSGTKKKRFYKILKEGVLDDFNAFFYNDFEEPVFKKHPEILSLKQQIRHCGAEFVLMTGSGSTIIGLFDDKLLADKALKSLSNRVLQVNLASFV
jgi:4-diphosphocytidyl-2-C-methyl-D-erythritol kinase